MNLNFNQCDIQGSVADIFKPETRIEAGFNLDSDLPIVLPTNIFNCDYKSNRMLIYQTRHEILPSFKYDTMDISTLLGIKMGRLVRMGLRCRIIKFVNDLKLSERIRTNFVLIEYFLSMRKVNLRSSYRLRNSDRYIAEATIRAENENYISGTHFSIYDISQTGIGVVIPKKIDNKNNPMLNLPLKQVLEIQLRLDQAESQKRPILISTTFEITRKLMSYNEKNGFIGACFTKMTPEDQESLFQYIFDAQRYEIRSFKHAL